MFLYNIIIFNAFAQSLGTFPRCRDGALKIGRGHLEENKLFRTVFTATEEAALLQSFKNLRNVGSQRMDVRAKIILERREVDDLTCGTTVVRVLVVLI